MLFMTSCSHTSSILKRFLNWLSLSCQMQHMKKLRVAMWVSFFSIAMGILECIVVIYLRKIYYPEGFGFPLKSMDTEAIGVELLRELATIVMLLAVGVLAGNTRTKKFGWFIYAFAVWDLSYYLFLKLLIGWPDSLMTLDILFLIPCTWVGPVLAPVINSLVMIFLAWVIIADTRASGNITLEPLEWVLLIIGSVIVIISYTIDYLNYMNSIFSIFDLLNLSKAKQVMATASTYMPGRFPWEIYLTGVLLHFAAIVSLISRKLKQ